MNTRRLFGFLLLGLFGVLVTAYWWINCYPNFHAVVDGELYRSAQLSRPQLEKYLLEKEISSVINLRGAQPKEDWWTTETAHCRDSGVVHHDFAWTNRAPPSREELEGFIEICRNTPKPLLIHCRSGADRTALGCALYLHHIKHFEEAESRECYSIRYGHVSWLSSRARKWNELFFARDD